jgi:hypothetical protein
MFVIAHIGKIPVEEWLPFVVPVLAICLYVRRNERRRREAIRRLPGVTEPRDDSTIGQVLERWTASSFEGVSREHLPLLYPPGPDGFNTAVYNYFAGGTSVALSDVVSFAIDGDLYLSHADGRIERFTGGTASPFSGPPPDFVAKNPVGLAIGEKSIYVGDPANRRIVQMTRAGTFQRVLVDPSDQAPLATIRDLAVDETHRTLLVLSGQSVYRYALPDAAQ